MSNKQKKVLFWVIVGLGLILVGFSIYRINRLGEEKGNRVNMIGKITNEERTQIEGEAGVLVNGEAGVSEGTEGGEDREEEGLGGAETLGEGESFDEEKIVEDIDTSDWVTYRNDLIEFKYPKSFGDYKDKYLYDDFDRTRIVGREIIFKEQGIKIEYAIPYAIIGRGVRGVEGQLGEIASTEPDLLEYCKRHEYYNCQKLTLDGFEFVEFYYPVYSLEKSDEFLEMLKVLLGRTPNETYPGLYVSVDIDLNKKYSLPLLEKDYLEIIDLINEIENSTSDERLEFFEIFKETLTFVQT